VAIALVLTTGRTRGRRRRKRRRHRAASLLTVGTVAFRAAAAVTAPLQTAIP